MHYGTKPQSPPASVPTGVLKSPGRPLVEDSLLKRVEDSLFKQTACTLT